ncbi:MAG: carbohydrate ABC transporter permease [Microcoleus sp.]
MRASQGYYFRLIHKFMGKSFDRSRALELLSFILLLVGAALVLLPLAAVFLVSVSPSGVGVKVTGWTFANYQEAWRRGNFLLAFLNSTLVAIAVTGFQVVTSALAGYALARLKFRGRQALVLVVLATLVIPFQLLVIPIFLVLKWGHLLNTYGALILPTAANGFGIFLLRQYFLTIPVELEEAAMLDGANRWQVLWQVMLPFGPPCFGDAVFVYVYRRVERFV